MAGERRCPDDLFMWGEKKTSVSEVRAFLDALGVLDRVFRVIHVAGTDDKGSVCAYLTEALRRTGYRVGTFVLPHLVDVRERILINGKMVSSEVSRTAAEMVKRQGETEVRADRNSPAYFEYLYYMAMLLLRRAGCEVITLETGPDGRLDAASSRAPCLTVLTSMSLDHIQYLGDTVEKIAAGKAGIIKKKVPVVYLDAVPPATDITAAKAREMQVLAYPVAPDRVDTRSAFLLTPYQRENAALTARALQVFSEGETGDMRRRMAAVSFLEAVRATVWTACMQEIHPDVSPDGAHSADGVLRMAGAGAALAAKRDKKLLLLTSSVQDKELVAIVETSAKVLHPACIYPASPHTSCRTEAYTLTDIYRNKRAAAMRTYGSVGEAFRQARGEQVEDAILFIAGSLYLVGEILAEESK